MDLVINRLGVPISSSRMVFGWDGLGGHGLWNWEGGRVGVGRYV